ncbi:MAG: glycosyltransferase family 2 protein [Fusobacteriaceae bacterium]
MKNEAIVSIITPLYNSEEFIEETINSVLNQTYKNWEMIITDDNSSDKGLEIVKRYSLIDNRIIYIELKKNSGAAVCRNISIKKARGKYIAFLDSDDLWKKNKLEKQIEFMEKYNYYFTFSKYQQMLENGTKINTYINVPQDINYNKALLYNPIGCLTAIYNQEKLGKIYMPLIRKRQDYGLWLKILKKTKGYGLNENLAYYRLRRFSMSANKVEMIKWHWILYRKVEGMNILKSAKHVIIYIFIKILKLK